MSTATYITTSAEQEIANLPSIEPREKLDTPELQVWATIKGEEYPLRLSVWNGETFIIETYKGNTTTGEPWQFIPVNGVDYRFTFQFDVADAYRAFRTPGGIAVAYSSILRSDHSSEPTGAAREAIWHGVFVTADEFANGWGRDLLTEAQEIYRYNEIAKAEQKIQDAIDQAARLIEQLEVTR